LIWGGGHRGDLGFRQRLDAGSDDVGELAMV